MVIIIHAHSETQIHEFPEIRLSLFQYFCLYRSMAGTRTPDRLEPCRLSPAPGCPSECLLERDEPIVYGEPHRVYVPHNGGRRTPPLVRGGPLVMRTIQPVLL